ncbi:hypothetical protein J2Z37_004334 [Ammoniphilus resinae]|uniref:Uncharacterized protein n=1 Tax=Ammoniphilus resinae TaxID=861532 RepID=A0ABS4GVL9_9BACL|nr:hypothetical protein [Ammoniphilus resinae]
MTQLNFHPDLISHEVFQEELVLISDMRATTLEELKKEPLKQIIKCERREPVRIQRESRQVDSFF